MPAASIKKHKLNSDTISTFLTIKANHDWKSLMSRVYISKPLTAGDLTSNAKVPAPCAQAFVDIIEGRRPVPLPFDEVVGGSRVSIELAGMGQ